MKPKNMILLVVAIACGLAASYMTSQLLANRDKAVPTVKVLVAKKRLPSYTNIKEPEQYFIEREFPETVAPKHAVTSFADAKDKRTNKVVNEEGVLLQDDLADAKTEGLSAQMAPGERAIAIKVNAEKQVAGFVLPGSRVDIVLTTRGDPEAKTILQNVLVLAVDSQAEKDAEKRTILGQTVTLSAKPEEAQRLALAEKLGDLVLVLRAFGDKDMTVPKSSKPRDLDRPLVEAQTEKPEEEISSKPITQLPPVLPPVAAAEEEKKEEKEKKVEPVVVIPPEPVKKIETHVLTIQNGESVQKAIFTREEGETTWKNGQIGKSSDDVTEQPKPAPARLGANPPKEGSK